MGIRNTRNRNLCYVIWLHNEHSLLSNPMHLVTPCYAEFLTFELLFSPANLLRHSSSISFFFSTPVWLFAVVAAATLPLNAFLSIPFSSHSNYAARICYTKVETFQQHHSTFSAPYIKHGNHFPYRRAYFLVECKYSLYSLLLYVYLRIAYHFDTYTFTAQI